MQKKTESKNSRVEKINKGKLMTLSKCAMCESKKRCFSKSKKQLDYVANWGLELH